MSTKDTWPAGSEALLKLERRRAALEQVVKLGEEMLGKVQAERDALKARVAELGGALLAVKRVQYSDYGPCWCNGYPHRSDCLSANAALQSRPDNQKVELEGVQAAERTWTWEQIQQAKEAADDSAEGMLPWWQVFEGKLGEGSGHG